MRTLFPFSLFFLGLVSMLLAWPVALLVLGGMVIGAWGPWMAGGLGLFVVLLRGGRLMGPYQRALRSGDSELVAGAGALFFVVGALAFLVAAVTAGFAGPHLYHAYAGERTGAVVIETKPAYWVGGGQRGTTYHIREYGSSRDLGWMERGPKHGVEEYARVEVSVDPHGVVAPVAADRIGGTGPQVVLLGVCFGATALAAGLVLLTALGVWPGRWW